jgi:putative serine protease PepD
MGFVREKARDETVKRLIPPLLFAVLAGALLATVARQLAGGSGNSSSVSAAARATASMHGVSSTGRRRAVASSSLTPTDIYKQDSPGVVSIKAVTADGADTGTGIVLNDEGLILTNDHVIAGAGSITVAPGGSSQASRAATLVGEEANADLALIKVDPSGLNLKALTLASSSSLQVGDTVYAIGNPYGLTETLTRGIVSALGRQISAPDGAAISGAIQTDAALNPGNSGGPLLNERGEVVGVNSQIASDAASVAGSQPGSTGVGFAIASDTVKQVVETIEAGHGVPSQNPGGEDEGPSEDGEGQSPFGRSSPSPGRGEAQEEAVVPPSGEGEGGSSRGGLEGAEPGVEGSESAAGEGGSRVVIVP